MDSHVDPGQSMGFALKRLQQALRSRMDAGLARYGLTTPQYAVLALLADQPGISNAELARRAFVTPPTMIRIVTTLAELGLLTRQGTPVEGRARSTRLTEEGRRRLNAAARAVQQCEDLLREQAGPGERELVLRWLADCADRLEAPQRAGVFPDERPGR
ncbi:DNA-binding MarR family transcriptional regulator [Kutzneria viridogrisea]|uniref:DNA-binding MarR family transcriptional regulator n=1 Tax=Kutzneria viridogrisea TaxID=47990 RepID=A0ABR6B7M8_9PSEU|nr:MarR family transcriptional regulator [Kutzneria albida]MBA8922868.1 DNA-binding MarR family transcriptional regulator [Kutzneria viridogrisea]